MLARPHTLSLITTHKCTAACDHCCFDCTPKVTKRIPPQRLHSLIDEAVELGSIRVVVFTGGECFLLGKELDQLVEHATRKGLITRCVTNGYWAVTKTAAETRLNDLVNAGLKEINLSTGPFHARFVPVSRIVHAARTAARLGLTTLVIAEIFNGADFEMSMIVDDPEIALLIKSGKIRVNRNVWIANGGLTQLTHKPEHSRFSEERKCGCPTALRVLAVTPDQSLVSCCGLHLEKIPELHLGSIHDRSIASVLSAAPDDFLKIWIHVEGPERILEFVRQYLPDYQLPLHMVHPCETCLHLYRDETAKSVIREHYHEVEDRIVEMYMAGIAADHLGRQINESIDQFADN